LEDLLNPPALTPPWRSPHPRRLGGAHVRAIVIAVLEEDPHRLSLSHPGHTALEEDPGGAHVVVIAVLEEDPCRRSLSRSGCAATPMSCPGHATALCGGCRSSSSVKIRMGCGEDTNERHEVLSGERRTSGSS
jgi:hypothetical protein